METNDRQELTQWVSDRLAVLQPPDDWETDAGAALRRFYRDRQTSVKRGRIWFAAALATAAFCAFALSFPPARVFAQRCVDACLAETGLSSKVARHDSTHVPFSPDFALPDASGQTIRLSDLRGQVVLVNFWATWCNPCAVEMPWLNDLAGRYRRSGLTVVGIAMDDDGWTSVRPFMTRTPLQYPIVLGNENLAQNFGGIDSLPTTFLFDRNGGVAIVYLGMIDRTTLESRVRSLLAQP